jgi:DNA-binding MarR family transcriptional regulator
MPRNAMPEGFAELLEYLNEHPEREYKAYDIQAAMQARYRFTSGKITGIINRAVERGVIDRISRSIYKLRSINTGAVSNVVTLCRNELQACISKIEATVAQRLTEMTDSELRDIRSLLRKLKELAGGEI